MCLNNLTLFKFYSFTTMNYTFYSFIIGQLTERENKEDMFLFYLLILCFCLISSAKLIDKNTFKTTLSSIFRIKKINKIHFIDSVIIHPLSSFLMILNFVLSISISTYILTRNYVINEDLYFYAIFASLCTILIPVIGVLFISFLLGDKNLQKNGLFITIRTFEFSGVFFLMLNMVKLSSLINENFFFLSALLFFILAYTHRSIKLSLKMGKSGFLWYHIILYLCTLEIVPFAIIAKSFSKILIG